MQKSKDYLELRNILENQGFNNKEIQVLDSNPEYIYFGYNCTSSIFKFRNKYYKVDLCLDLNQNQKYEIIFIMEVKPVHKTVTVYET